MTDALELEAAACLLCGASDDETVAISPVQQHTTRDVFRFVRCRACALVRLHPRVRAERVGVYYDATYLPHRGAAAWGRYAPIVERALGRTDRARVKRVLATKRLTSVSRVLDVGCGRPTFLRALRDATGAHAVGIDFVDEAWRGDPARWSGLELHEGTLENAPLTPGFDAMTLWHALEHDYQPLATLRRLRALAAPDAVLVIEVPNYDSLWRIWHGAQWAGFHTPRHTVAFTPATLRHLVEKAGWRVEQQLRYGTLDPYISWWLGRQELNGLGVRGDLSGRFFSFVLGKALSLPLTVFQRWVSMGAQTLIARA